VKKADVSFEKKQATVMYDPKATSVAKLIEVVENAPNMMGGSTRFEAKVHHGKMGFGAKVFHGTTK